MRTWFTEAAGGLTARARGRLDEARESDRGDVPGWVMVTLMSALLVAVIFGLAETQLSDILTRALQSVLP